MDGSYRSGASKTGSEALVKLDALMKADNIADMLTDDQLASIGDRVKREYQIDLTSQADWRACNEVAMKLAMQVTEKKNYPWPNAANVKFPLLTTASMQFAARAYPAIVGTDVVKAKVIGKDEGGEKRERGDRVSAHMSYQLTYQMDEWEEDTDKLLHVLPITGVCYRKTYYSPSLGRNKSELVLPDKLVVNNGVRSLDAAPRITQEIELYPLEVKERELQGIFKENEYGQTESDDDDAPMDFLEQHRRLDLDEDGYPEPYIVTVHKDTGKVARIVANYDLEDNENYGVNRDGNIARIEPIKYFTKYGFFPNPSGGFLDIGFGYLLRPLNEAVNTTINQLLDAGHLQNAGGGFIGSGARLKGGMHKFSPGKYTPVDVNGQDLKNNIVPFNFQGPSVVLFQLLGLLIDAAKDISSVKDAMTGEAQGKNQSPTTTLALIEQGMQVFSAIYKRIFRSLKKEYGKLYLLNGKYLGDEEYVTILDEQKAVSREDYGKKDLDIVPVADPSVVTNMQKMSRAEFMMSLKDDPRIDGVEVLKRVLEAASIDDPEGLMAKETPPNPQVLKDADEIDIKKKKLELDEIKLQAEIGEIEARTIKFLAEAEGIEPGRQLEEYKAHMQALRDEAKHVLEEKKIDSMDKGKVPGVAGQSGNQGVSGISA